MAEMADDYLASWSSPEDQSFGHINPEQYSALEPSFTSIQQPLSNDNMVNYGQQQDGLNQFRQLPANTPYANQQFEQGYISNQQQGYYNPGMAFRNALPQAAGHSNGTLQGLPLDVRQRIYGPYQRSVQLGPQDLQHLQLQQALQQQSQYQNADQNSGHSLPQEQLDTAVPNFRGYPQSHEATQSTDVPDRRQDPVPISRAPNRHSRVASETEAVSEQPTVSEMGPATRKYSLPDRPKPGRKPMPEAAASDRRRKQNRDAQRNFRDKRASRVADLSRDVEKARQERVEQAADYERRLEDQRKEIVKINIELKKAQTALQDMAERALTAENKLKNVAIEEHFRASGFQNPRVVNNGASQPALPNNTMNFAPIPVDFTDIFGSNDNQENCGFCTDETNCTCKAEQTKKRKVAPGSCEACQIDPERAEACRSLARQTSMDDGKANSSFRNDSMADAPEGMMSCSTMIDRMGGTGQRLPSIADVFPGTTLHSYGAESGMGYNVNEQEAAQVLQSMSRRNTAVSPTHV